MAASPYGVSDQYRLSFSTHPTDLAQLVTHRTCVSHRRTLVSFSDAS